MHFKRTLFTQQGALFVLPFYSERGAIMAYPTTLNYPNYFNYQQPVYQPPQPAQSAQGLSMTSRLVSSREEAGSVPADFGGNLMVFPDISHNRIYVKRWNYQTGAAEFMEFEPVSEKREVIEYATKDDIKRLEEELSKLKGAQDDDE